MFNKTLGTAALCVWTVLVGCGDITVAPAPAEEDTTTTTGCQTNSDCDSGDQCRTGECDQGSGQCVYTLSVGACYIDGTCYAEGSPSFDRCEVCTPDESTTSFSPVSCSDGQTCDPDSGACVDAPGDVVTDTDEPDTSVPDAGEPDTDEPDVEEDAGGPDTTDTTDPPGCETNEDCADQVVLGPCDAAACVVATGSCVVVSLPAGSACAPNDVLSPACWSGTCTDEGQCDAEPLTNTGCDDGDDCTLSDVCSEGLCQGQPLDCSDGNPCTQDLCEDGQCSSVAWQVEEGVTLPCDDGNACTTDDACNAGQCEGGANVCACTVTADCVDDGNLCNGTLVCVDQGDGTKACEVDPQTVVTCDTSTDTTCLETTCDVQTGQCNQVALDGTGCDDDDPCTFGDKCTALGTCGGTPVNCNDDNVCTDDACNGGTCANVPNTGPCNDGDGCTVDDVCGGGTCGGTAKPCDDNDPCTTDACVEGECVFTPTPGAPCDDGNHCTTADECGCSGGSCGCIGTLVVCDDNNPCTDEQCNPGVVPSGYDPMLPLSACQTANNSAPCSDGNACTLGDTCNGGQCTAGTGTLPCTGSECENAECDPATGCVVVPKAPDTGCDDGNPCTDGEVCNGTGSCGGGATICSCQVDTDCDDGNACNGVETCVDNGGVKTCQAGSPVVCPPATNPCKVAACNPNTGTCQVTNAQNGTVCGTDDACETNKVCQAGSCEGDKVTCTPGICQVLDGCDPDSGCKYSPAQEGAPCDDGSVCTIGDVCTDNGTCKSEPIDCDDNDACTAESCNPTSGCKYTPQPDSTPCEADGDLCTADQCSAGQCVQKSSTFCSDGVSCTTDSCNAATGNCQFVPNASACDDGNPCTEDSCGQNGCVNVPMADFDACDDGDEGTGPDFCFQGSCLKSSRVEAVPNTFSLCPISVRQGVALSMVSGTLYAAVNYVSQTYNFPNGCGGKLTQYMQVAKVDGGSTLDYLGGQTGEAYDMAGTVVVGAGSLVGRVLSDSVDYDEFASEVKSVTGLTDLKTVSLVNTFANFQSYSNYLVGGKIEDGAGVAARCQLSSFGGLSCGGVEVSGGASSNNRDYVSSALSSATIKCSPAPCLANSEVSGGWLGSASGDGYLDLYQAESSEPVFQSQFDAQNLGAQLRGSVWAGDTVFYHYGAEGLLYRCEEGECVAIDVPFDNVDFVDAYNYGEGLVLLATKGSQGRLIFIPADSEPGETSDWKFVEFSSSEQDDVYTSLAGSTSTGLFVFGHTAEGSDWILWSFALP